MRHLQLTPLKLSTWRKIALGSWRTAGDPSVYGTLEINAKLIQERQKRYAARTGGKAPTITAIVGKAIAMTFHKHPQINGLIRFGRIYNRKDVTLFLQTAVDDMGEELSGVTIAEAEKKSIEQIVEELKNKAAMIRQGKDPAFKQAKGTFKHVPAFLTRYLLNAMSFLLYTLNLDMRWAGLPRDPFGSVMITSIGGLGLDEGFAPIVPYSRVPLLIAVGKIRERPGVEGGQVCVVPMFKLCVTFDHRFIDGVHGSKMVRTARHYLETAEGLDELGLF